MAVNLIPKLLEDIEDCVDVIDEWFRKCREVRYCDDADPLLIVENVYGRIETWEGLVKSSMLRIAPTVTYSNFKQLLQFIENSGFVIRAVKGAGSEVGVLINSEAVKRIEDVVASIARSLVKVKVLEAARVAINVVLGDRDTHWELIIQECLPGSEELTEYVEDSIRVTLKLVDYLGREALSSMLGPAVNVVGLECGFAKALCVGLRINLM